MKRFWLGLITFICLGGLLGPSMGLAADELSDLKARIEALEKKQGEGGAAASSPGGSSWTDRFTIGAHVRVRHEGRYNYDRQAVIHDDDNFTLLRARLSVDGKIPDVARAFVQVQSSQLFGAALLVPSPFGPGNLITGATGNVDDEGLTLHQGYADIFYDDFTLRIGRQEMKFGDERLVGSLEWSNRSRSFDGVSLIHETEGHKFQAFFHRLTDTPRVAPPASSKDAFFTGFNNTLKGQDAQIEYYALVFFDMDAGAASPALLGYAGDRDLLFLTLGGRLRDMPQEGLGYELEVAGQAGENGAAKIFAYAAHAAAQFGLGGDMAPRVLLEYNIASGDDARTKTDTAFRNLFPTNHSKYGYIDFMGWSNMHNIRVGLFVDPVENASIEVSGHQFFAYQPDGAIGAFPAAIAASGAAGPNRYRVGIGRELDVTVSYKYKKAAKFLLGYSLFLPGDLLKKEATPFADDNVQFGYAQVQVDI